MKNLTPSELKLFLLNIAPVRPVYIWGAPGIGKTAIVTAFASEVGMESVSMLGSQLAPEDLIGVPRIVDGHSVFAPPRTLAGRHEPFVLFIDEFNASSPEVQKSFYSLILEQRLGEYQLPAGSVVILAGNRAADNAIVRSVSSALMNRVVHVELRANHRDWIEWAHASSIHSTVIRYLQTRPDHLFVNPPKTEEPFSTPRSWHMLSDGMTAYGEELDEQIISVLASGTISPSHALSFTAFAKQLTLGLEIDDIISGRVALPLAPDQRDLLFFVVQGVRAQLTKALPDQRNELSSDVKELVHNARRLIAELARADEELVLVLLAREEGDDARNYPNWFLVEVVKTLPRLKRLINAETI